MKLYTKQGDDGTTGLIGGARVRKDNLRVVAVGHVDETNAAIGVALSACNHNDVTAVLREVQADLFLLGAELASQQGSSPALSIHANHVSRLENWIDEATSDVPPLKHFILPAGSEAAARLHYARSVCRRAERSVVSLAQNQTIRPSALMYLNRLSDLLFALARRTNSLDGIAEIPWRAPGSE